jgi:signal transduction histidine kinase
MALNVRSASLLAGVLLDDVEQIVDGTASRMQELLPSYARWSREDLIPVVLADTRHLLEAIRDPDADRSRADMDHRASGETRARRGVTSDDLLQGWRIGLEVVREEAHARADELGIRDCVLLEFFEATLRWGDVGMRALVLAHRELEISELGRLAEEQAALRRVATMVARESPPQEILHKVAEEAGLLLRADTTVIHRFDADGLGTVVGSWGKAVEAFPVGRRTKLDGRDSATASAYRDRQPIRVEGYEDPSGAIAKEAKRLGFQCAVACPLFVTGRLWGAVTLGSSSPEPMPAGTESRLAEFTELAATAISNLHARAEAERLAEEQAALRRVATMVAHERAAEDVLARVVEEVGRIGGADTAVIHRFDPDGNSTVVASYGALQESFWVGSRWKLEGNSVAVGVYRTGRPVRFDHYERSEGSIALSANMLGIRSGVGSPIVVNGRLWGVIAAGTSLPEPLPADAEPRMAEFTELAATAISNVQARSDLAASRARVIATADEQRGRVARDLHDGAQQRLVTTILTLELARSELERDQHDAAVLVGEALAHAQAATAELRELARGILPGVLTHGGLHAGVRALTSRMSIPVEIEVAVGRLPSEVEATAYFIVAEALTNVAKHSRARHAAVCAQLDSHCLQVEVRDDGVGGAHAAGTGLVGLRDRLALLDGSLRVENPADGGTLIAASIPLGATPPIRSGGGTSP